MQPNSVIRLHSQNWTIVPKEKCQPPASCKHGLQFSSAIFTELALFS